MPDRRASTVGKYQILDLIGEGAMGNVYRALDPVLNRTVAVKVMSDAIALDDELRGRFLREAQAAGSLQHPNLVTVYDFGEVDGHLFIAMEFVPGMDLETVLRRRDPLTLQTRLEITIDVLTGLAYAHKRGIVHRDIKPANIRITEEQRAKIMDFGVAHLESSNLTRTGVMVGTPNYMAPEQITGASVGPATDVFSAGAVLYELLTHTKAFGADTLHNVLFKVVSEQPPSVTALLPGLPTALDDIVSRSLAKSPEERYQTALDMANDLSAVRASLSGATPHAASVSLASTLAARVSAPTRSASPAKAAKTVEMTPPATLATKPAGSSRGALFVTGGLLALAGAVIWTAKSVRQMVRDEDKIVRADSAILRATGGSPATPPATPAARPDSTPVAAAAAAGRDDTSTKATLDPAVVRSLRASAELARSRALAAGALRSQLTSGDVHFAAADRSFKNGSATDAAEHIAAAVSAWLDAERAAQRAANAAAQQSPTVSAPAPATTQPAGPSSGSPARPEIDTSKLSTPAVRPSAPAQTEPAPINVPRATAAPARSADAEIRDVVLAYAHAIESRDIGLVRTVYPGLTAEQQKGFEGFFGNVRSLQAALAVESLEVTGPTATGRITGTYDFTASSGKATKQPVSFRATFRKDGNDWKLVAVR